MFYIHQTSCISHQPTFTEVDLDRLIPSVHNQLPALEPAYTHIPIGQLRRMGRALRMGVGTGMQLLEKHRVDGIIIGTANSGIEDSISFLNQIIDYNEGRLTPTHFVQSTFNAIAGLLGMITHNTGYNATHVHRGLAFENVLLDAAMRLEEHPEHTYLVGGVDEISVRNYRMEALAGWYKKEATSNTALYHTNTPGSLPGEGAAMFLVNKEKQGAIACLKHIQVLNTTDEHLVSEQVKQCVDAAMAQGDPVEVFLSGENGDARFSRFYAAAEAGIPASTTVLRFKHMFGEFQTVSALALWLMCRLMTSSQLPAHMIKKQESHNAINRMLCYNNYRGEQHSVILLERIQP